MTITIYTMQEKTKLNSEDSVVAEKMVFSETMHCIDTKTWHVISICDGVGGNPGGKEASLFVSNMIASASFDDMNEEEIKAFFSKINNELLCYAATLPDEKNMATTCTALINSNNGLFLVHIGNCRLYKLQGKYLKQLSSDQTIHQLLKSSCVFEDAEKNNKNEIYACMGGGSTQYSYHLIVKKLGESYKNENLIMTSDGIHDYVSDAEMERLLNESEDDKSAVRKIVNFARNNGSTDDCSIIIVRS